jgi:hypothetical protein
VVTPIDHVNVVAGPVDHDRGPDRWRSREGLVRMMLESNLLAPPVATVGGDQQSLIRPASDSAENPPKITVWGAPILAQASMAIGSSGIIGM